MIGRRRGFRRRYEVRQRSSFSADGRRPDGASGAVVVDGDDGIVGEPGEDVPAIEVIVDGFLLFGELAIALRSKKRDCSATYMADH